MLLTIIQVKLYVYMLEYIYIYTNDSPWCDILCRKKILFVLSTSHEMVTQQNPLNKHITFYEPFALSTLQLCANFIALIDFRKKQIEGSI